MIRERKDESSARRTKARVYIVFDLPEQEIPAPQEEEVPEDLIEGFLTHMANREERPWKESTCQSAANILRRLQRFLRGRKSRELEQASFDDLCEFLSEIVFVGSAVTFAEYHRRIVLLYKYVRDRGRMDFPLYEDWQGNMRPDTWQISDLKAVDRVDLIDNFHSLDVTLSIMELEKLVEYAKIGQSHYDDYYCQMATRHHDKVVDVLVDRLEDVVEEAWKDREARFEAEYRKRLSEKIRNRGRAIV